MSITLSKFSTTQIPGPSSRGNLDTGDIIAPYSFQEWIKRNVGLLPTQYVTDYNKYLQSWYKGRESTREVNTSTNLLKEKYRNFMRQVALSYKNSDEARLFTDIDFENDFEAASVIPLIARKLKSIAAYYASKRESVKPSKLKYNMTGTNRAIERILYQYILRSFTKYPYNYTVNDQTLTNAFSALSSICQTFEVQVEELYDEATYFDSTSALQISAYTDYTQSANFSAFADLTEEMLKAIHETRFYDSTTYGTIEDDLSLLYQLLTTGSLLDASNIPGYDPSVTYPLSSFVDYVSGSQINEYYQPFMAAKYLGSDYYALSTDSEGRVVLAGKYLAANTPQAYLNNTVNPTVAVVPNYDSIKSKNEIGGFHIPSHLGALTYGAVSPLVRYTTDGVQPNSVYFVPDPNLYTSIRGVSLTSNFSPVYHEFEYSWLKQRNTSVYAQGIIKNFGEFPIFKAYQSKYETRKFDGAGIQRVNDQYDFWTGETSSIWSRQDLYPLNWRGEYNIEARTNNFDVSGKQLVNWNTDIYGTNYGLYKTIKNVDGNYVSIYNKRHQNPGELWVRTPYDNIVPGATALSAIYAKYATVPAVYSQLSAGEIYSIDVIYDVLVIELADFVLFEKIEFDYTNNTIKNTNTTSKVFNLSADNMYYGGFWFHEKDKRLTVCTCVSSSYGGIPYIYPELFRIGLDNFSIERIYTGYEDTNVLLPITQVFFTEVDAPQLTYNNDTDTFNVSILCKDANKKVYIISIDVTDRV
jgi:hypothetical protein